MAQATNGEDLMVIDYSELLDAASDLSQKIEAAFGSTGLGVIAVRSVPGYEQAREDLLPFAERLYHLPDEAKQRLEDPESSFSFGWSMGKEALEDSRMDTMKGSFYANPVHDVPTRDADLIRQYPSYCRPNIWPNEDLPALEPAFKNLGGIIVDAGMKLVHHCDRFVSKCVKAEQPSTSGCPLSDSLNRSLAHKARLLLYQPWQGEGKEDELHHRDSRSSDESRPLWCAWHLDHGSLTGLTRAMYQCAGKEVPSPDEGCGLFVRKRNGQEVQVLIPQGCIAFQMGQAMSIMSGGVLFATPHCVKAAVGSRCQHVSRSTFAVFMQPSWDEPLVVPPGTAPPSSDTIPMWGPWREGLTFGEFAEALFSKYYG